MGNESKKVRIPEGKDEKVSSIKDKKSPHAPKYFKFTSYDICNSVVNSFIKKYTHFLTNFRLSPRYVKNDILTLESYHRKYPEVTRQIFINKILKLINTILEQVNKPDSTYELNAYEKKLLEGRIEVLKKLTETIVNSSSFTENYEDYREIVKEQITLIRDTCSEYDANPIIDKLLDNLSKYMKAYEFYKMEIDQNPENFHPTVKSK